VYIENIKRNGRGRLKAFFMVGAFVYGLGYLRLYPTPLSQHSQRVAELPAKTIPFRYPHLAEFYPLSDREVLVLLRPAGPQAFRVREATSVFDRLVYRIDLKTGKAARYLGLEKAISDWPWYGYQLSPDRRFLLCAPTTWKHPGRIVDLSTAKVVRHVSLPPSVGGAWFPDSRSVASFAYDRKAEARCKVVRFGLTDRDPTEAYEIRFPSGSESLRVNTAAPNFVRPDGTFVCLSSFQDSSAHPWHQTMQIQELRPRENHWVVQPMRWFDPPSQMIFNEVVRLNPAGTRLLWQAVEQTTMTRKTWMLFTANLDGTNQRRIGTMPVIGERDPAKAAPSDGPDDDLPPEPAFGAEWMPDGKTICFVANGVFYLAEDR
jgi:hypothetical protein